MPIGMSLKKSRLLISRYSREIIYLKMVITGLKRVPSGVHTWEASYSHPNDYLLSFDGFDIKSCLPSLK